jgi:hypothetical protein
MRLFVRCFASLATAIAVGAVANAGDTSYLGAWRIESAKVAPWADPRQRADPTEARSLIGKTIRFTPREIAGPKVFACSDPKYRVVDWPAEMLFQGALDEMRQANPAVSPLSLAHSLGFEGTTWKSLETGCEFDWHFVQPGKMETGLNDYVYVLRKE